MSHPVAPRLGALAVAALVIIAACTADKVVAPPTSKASNAVKTVGVASGGDIEVCIDPLSPPGNYTISATRTDPDDSTDVVDVFAPLTTNVHPNGCVTVLQRFSLMDSNGAICWHDVGGVQESYLCPPGTAFAAGWATVTVTPDPAIAGAAVSWQCVVADPSTPSYCYDGTSGSGNTFRNGANVYHGTNTTVLFTPQVAQFVIGDVEPHSAVSAGLALLNGKNKNFGQSPVGGGDIVNFWGSQWWKNNIMSQYTSSGYPAFKGFADLSDNRCGGTWTSLGGNSSKPPQEIGENVAVIVTSNVWKNGPNLSGNIKEIILVHQDGKYGPNPGHDGNGPVISVICSDN